MPQQGSEGKAKVYMVKHMDREGSHSRRRLHPQECRSNPPCLSEVSFSILLVIWNLKLHFSFILNSYMDSIGLIWPFLEEIFYSKTNDFLSKASLWIGSSWIHTFVPQLTTWGCVHFACREQFRNKSISWQHQEPSNHQWKCKYNWPSERKWTKVQQQWNWRNFVLGVEER